LPEKWVLFGLGLASVPSSGRRASAAELGKQAESNAEGQLRTAAAILTLLASMIWFAAHIEVDGPANVHSAPISPWRRTRTGWERSDTWLTAAAASRRSTTAAFDLPHPAFVALFELLAASLFLLSTPTSRTRA
jgi:hypothetical protein